jgi:ABC-2 type transport system ATP-binding protein
MTQDASDNREAVVAARNLTKVYGDQTVVDDVSFELSRGTVTGFVGPNGAGKSTTLRMLLGLTRATSGAGLIAGRPYGDMSNPARLVGAVLESNDFHPGRSGRDHLRVLAVQSSLPVAAVSQALEMVGLTSAATKQVKTYSLGMRQRLGLAGALLGTPSILLLDEPANGLDPAGTHWLRGLLRDFAQQGGTALVASHLLAELAQTVDRVLILSGGKLRADTDIATLEADGRSLEDAYLALTSERTS